MLSFNIMIPNILKSSKQNNEKPASGCFALQNKDKKFNFAPKIGWRALAEGEPATCFPNWRRGGDSNPRFRNWNTGFQDRPVQPLRHLS